MGILRPGGEEGFNTPDRTVGSGCGGECPAQWRAQVGPSPSSLRPLHARPTQNSKLQIGGVLSKMGAAGSALKSSFGEIGSTDFLPRASLEAGGAELSNEANGMECASESLRMGILRPGGEGGFNTPDRTVGSGCGGRARRSGGPRWGPLPAHCGPCMPGRHRTRNCKSAEF